MESKSTLEEQVRTLESEGKTKSAIKLASQLGIGRVIYILVRDRKYDEAVELAYNEFGIKRAIKIYLNAGMPVAVGRFYEDKGLFEEAYEFYCKIGYTKKAHELAIKLNLSTEALEKKMNRKRPAPMVL